MVQVDRRTDRLKEMGECKKKKKQGRIRDHKMRLAGAARCSGSHGIK